MSKMATTFAQREEFERARRVLEEMRLPYDLISPDPGYAQVGVPSLVMHADARMALAARDNDFLCSGWVVYRPARIAVPSDEPPIFAEDIFGQAAIMVLAPCVADETKIRLIAHISGDMTEVFPYLNTEMQIASYNRNGPTFTFMDGYRMVSMYPRRIAIAKADEIVDAWRTLETIRRKVNEVWARRAEIKPSWEMRKKPSPLEIFKRLPGTNCGLCGEPTCLAFAVRLWNGDGRIAECKPVVEGEHRRLKDALVEICRGLGVPEAIE